MGFFSILDLQEPYRDALQPFSYWIDFNLDRIMKEIVECYKSDVSRMYQYFPADEKTSMYRRQVYEDVCNEKVFAALNEYKNRMAAWQYNCENKELTRSELQKKVMTATQAEMFGDAVSRLQQDLRTCSIHSDGLLAFQQAVEEYVHSVDFQDFYESVKKIRRELSEISFTLTYEKGRMAVAMSKAEGTYSKFLSDLFPLQELRDIKNPIGEGVEITALEDEILEMIRDKKPEVFRNLEHFYGKHEQYVEAFLVRFFKEIPFYLSFATFEQKMKEQGFAFCSPLALENQTFKVTGLYDLALACQNYRDSKPVIDNDMELKQGEQFFVLTGPNQGGKTTFARSLGQLIYFTKMGLHVPAVSASVPYYHRILTHFSVEESVETGKGKLAEELSRLKPMLETADEKNDFVVINELFTTAANYDANIMGKRVLDHFIRLNCYGIYVTHIHELSEEREGVVSLRALLDENHKQNYKVVRSNEPEGVSAIAMVEKHRLNYELLTERLRGLNA